MKERASTYAAEKANWIDLKAFTPFPKEVVPQNSNIIGSHVSYKRKNDGCAFAHGASMISKKITFELTHLVFRSIYFASYFQFKSSVVGTRERLT